MLYTLLHVKKLHEGIIYFTECCSDRLKCLFPSIHSIPPDVLHSVSYSLVLTGVPGLSQLERRSGLAVNIVDDPVFDLIGTVLCFVFGDII